MQHQLHVLGISGSLRKASFNTGLLRAAQEVTPQNMELTIFDIKDIPLYNGDVESEGDPEAVVALKAAIREADGILFATPEYNFGPSGVLKNALDWASRDRESGSIVGKAATLIGAGGRAGTARSQMQFRENLAEAGALNMLKPGVLVTAFAPMMFDEMGNVTNQDTKEALAKHLEEFARWIDRIKMPNE